MFTSTHFIWILISLSIIIIGSYLTFRFKLQEHTVSLIMAFLCIISEGTKMSQYMIYKNGGYILDPFALPLHLCSMMIFVVGYIAMTKNESHKQMAIDFLVPMGFIGGVSAQLIPMDGVSFSSVKVWQGFLFHAVLLWYVFYFIISKRFDYSFKSYIRNIKILLILALLSIYENSILNEYDTNFMFTHKPPVEGLPILNLNHGWFVYIMILIVLVMAGLLVFYSFFWLKERKDRQ
ncbi:MAG: YwaF family protein [Erysipelotrichaceae bacterium]|nr:YwaF family protein [Erysipelotrichaceae bacterium]